MKKQYVFGAIRFLIFSFLLLLAGPALGGNCSLLEDNLTAQSATNWILDEDGSWNFQNDQLEVTTSSTESWSTAIRWDDFNPGQPFSVEVDFSTANAIGTNDACGLYVYTTATFFDPDHGYLVNGIRTDGMQVIVHPSNHTMQFRYWDVVNWTTITTDAVAISWPLSSFGLSFTENAVFFRANGADTQIKISGAFNPQNPALDTLSLMAIGQGATFSFSHLCVTPYEGNSGGDIPPTGDYPNAAPSMSLTAVEYGGGTLVNPADIPVAVAADPLLIQPTLAVNLADRGQTANLFAYLYLPQVRAGFNFSAPQPVTLGDVANFAAVFPQVIDMTGQDGFVFDVYYGYALADGSIHYSAYEVTLGGSGGGGGGSGLKKSRTVGLGADVAGSLDASILKVLSNAGETGLPGSGSVSIDFLHDDENVPNPTLLMVTNAAGNPILLKMSDDPGDDFTAATTALALVLYDPNILLLPHEDFLRVRTAVQADSRLAGLTAAILALIQVHDPNPLDYDSHPELYQQAVDMAQDALQSIVPAGSYSGFQDSAFQEDKGIKPLEVVDDKGHSTNEVVPTNRTMCYYEIKAGKDGKPFRTYKIERRNLLDYHIIKWPLEFNPGVDFEVTSKIDIGDGALTFNFEKEKKLTVVYCMLSVATTAIGAGSTKLEDIEEGLGAVAGAGGEIAALMQQMITNRPANQVEANKMAYNLIYGVFHSGYTLVTTVYEKQIKEQLQHNFFKTAFKIAGSKVIAWGSASYAASDIAVTLWDLHYAPDTYNEVGNQVSGEYPVRLTIINVEPNNGRPGDEITVDFSCSIPDAVMPIKLMLGSREVATIHGNSCDNSQHQLIFTVPEGTETGTLKLTYGIAESNGVTFTVGDPAATVSGSGSGESHTVCINDGSYYYPTPDIKMALSASWQVSSAHDLTISTDEGWPDSQLSNTTYGKGARNFIILFDLSSPQWEHPNQGTFKVTLENSAIKGAQASYSTLFTPWYGNVTFGQPYYTIDKSLSCSKTTSLEESGIEFSVSQNDNVITGNYLFPGSREGAFVHLLLNIPYTRTLPDDPNTTVDESVGIERVWFEQGILLLFRNYNPMDAADYQPSDPCACSKSSGWR